LVPAARIQSRSALLARAAEQRTPVACLAPQSCVTLGYRDLLDVLAGVTAA